jgi:4-hydroxy-3-methylbut-2-enyl diphosphate reductase
MPVYFIKDADELVSVTEINHFEYSGHIHKNSKNWLPINQPVTIVLTSGASCPDPIVEAVLNKVLSFYPNSNSIESVLEGLIKS